jgi:transcriptional regulator of heat shock response
MNREKNNETLKRFNELLNKSKLYKLKRHEKNEMKKMRKVLFFLDKKEIHNKIMEKKKKEFEVQIKKENENFEKEKEKIIKEKNESIQNIESNKIRAIKEINIKYKNLFTYLDSIKNDKEKILEFFKYKIDI